MYKNKNKQKHYQKLWMQNKRIQWRPIFYNLKINGCAICGYNEHTAALEFHHGNPEDKSFNITKGQFHRSDKKIVNELNKCILLCCNCHTIIHYKED